METMNNEDRQEERENGKDNEAAAGTATKMCQAIEEVFGDPLQIIDDSIDGGELEIGEKALSFDQYVDQLERAAFPAQQVREKYRVLKEEVDKKVPEMDFSDIVSHMIWVKERTHFIVGAVYGMRLAGARMDEIERVTQGIVARQRQRCWLNTIKPKTA